MKTIRAYEIGGPEVLKLEDAPDPIAGPGEAIVDLKSIGVNYTDVSSRKGTNVPAHFPWTPGREGCGVVTAIPAHMLKNKLCRPGYWSKSPTQWILLPVLLPSSRA